MMKVLKRALNSQQRQKMLKQKDVKLNEAQFHLQLHSLQIREHQTLSFDLDNFGH